MLARIERITPGGAASFVCKRRADPRFEFHWHVHPEIELTLILRSRGRRFVGDSIEDYREGDLVLLGSDLPHTWRSDPGRRGRHEAVVVQFGTSFLGRDFFGRPELGPVRRLLERAGRGLLFTGRTQRAAARDLGSLPDLDPYRRVVALLGTLGVLAASREARPLSSRDFVPTLRRAEPQRIDRVCRFVNDRFAERLPLADAAALAHLSVPAFCRFFRRATGKTFTAYVNEIRVGHACRLLVETDQTAAQAAFASGFNNLSNFNRRFRELKGMSPREFRRSFTP
jgi:AraC-like DNA-binding protein